MSLKRSSLISKIRKVQRRILDFIVRHHPALDLESRAEGFVRIFEKSLLPESRILDIGGGWGFYHKPLRSRGHQHLVLDVIKPGLQNCPVVIYDGKRFPFPDKSFDTSLFVTVLHHVPDPESVIREALRVTRGRIILIEDVYHHRLGRWWTVLRDQILNVEFFGHPKNFKTSEAWTRLFENMGCSLLDKTEIKTTLSGFEILNSVFVFETGKLSALNQKQSSQADSMDEAGRYQANLGVFGFAEVQKLPEENKFKACGRIPETLECFQDHFPGFPILPGVLALEIQKKLAVHFEETAFKNGTVGGLKVIRSVKFASFLKPGDAWEYQGEGKTGPGGQKVWKARLFSGGRPAAAAELVFEAALPDRKQN